MIGTDIKKIEEQFPEYIEVVEKNYWWNFVVIALDSSFYSFSVAMLSQDTIVPYFVSQLTQHKYLVGLVPALYYLGYFFPQLIGAYIVNSKTTRKWVIFGIAVTERIGILAIALIAQFINVLSPSLALGLLMFSYMVFSISNGMIAPGYADFISKNIIKNRGFFYGVMNGLGGLIGFGASLLASNLLDAFSFPINLQHLFWIGFATSFISPIFIANFREVRYPIERKVEPLMEFIKAIPGHVKASSGFQHYMIARAVLGLGILANAFFVLDAIERFSLSAGAVGIFTMLILFTQSLLGFIWGWVGDHFGFKQVYVISSLMIAAMGFLSLTAFHQISFYIIALCIGGVYAAIRTGDPNMIFEIAPPAETSRFIGISNTFVAPVMTLAPLIGGFLVDAVSYQFVYWLVLAIGIASTLLSIFVMPDPRHKDGA